MTLDMKQEELRNPGGEWSYGEAFDRWLARRRTPNLTLFTSMASARAAFDARLPRQCEVCTWRPPADLPHSYTCLDLHHVVPRSRGGGDMLTNLVQVCANCHRVAHALLATGRFQPSNRAEFVPGLRRIYAGGAA